MAIKLLSDQTIGKIAAGEVIERPVSIVKELLENAVDSGATRIAVEIRNGGSGEIRVVDDGCGIPAAEMALAVQRHATSKLSEFSDLERVRTLGFRGEALASIAAVSRIQIRSSEPNVPVGTTLVSQFGSSPEISPGPPVGGTTVTVNDLFANVPARLKFLKQPSTESTAIQRVVAAYAASRADLSIRLTIDERTVFSTDGTARWLLPWTWFTAARWERIGKTF